MAKLLVWQSELFYDVLARLALFIHQPEAKSIVAALRSLRLLFTRVLYRGRLLQS